MIIERQYVPFSVLFNTDKEAWNIFEKAFNESYPEHDRDRIMEMLLPQCLYQREMGWCFNKLVDVIEGFKKLDQERPYDNGFTYADSNISEIVEKYEDGVVIHLIHSFDGVRQIVKVIDFKY